MFFALFVVKLFAILVLADDLNESCKSPLEMNTVAKSELYYRELRNTGFLTIK